MFDETPDAREFAIYYRVAAARQRQVDVAKAFEISQSQVSKIVAKVRCWVGIAKPDKGLSPGEEVYAAADAYRAKLEYAERRATDAFDLTMKQAEAGDGRVKPCPRLHKAMVESIKDVFAAEKVCAGLRIEAELAKSETAPRADRAPENAVAAGSGLNESNARNQEYSSTAVEEERYFRGAKGDYPRAKGDHPEEYSEVVVAPVVEEDSLAALACGAAECYWEVIYADGEVNELVAETIAEYRNIPEEECPVLAEEMVEYDGNTTPLRTMRWWTVAAPEGMDHGRYFRGAKGDQTLQPEARARDRSPEVTEQWTVNARDKGSTGVDRGRYFRGAKGDNPEESAWHEEGILQLACAAAR